MKVLVIGGGISDEREVSLRSSRSAYEGARQAGYHAVHYDWQGSFDWLDKNIVGFDVVLPILHGKGGEDGQIQTYLESKTLNSWVVAQALPKYAFPSRKPKNCWHKIISRSLEVIE